MTHCDCSMVQWLEQFTANLLLVHKIRNAVSRMFNFLLLAQPNDMMPKNNQELTQSKNWTWLSENEIAIKAKVTKNRAFKNSHNPANFDPSLNWTFELRFLSSAASGPLHWWKANLPTFGTVLFHALKNNNIVRI